MSILNVKSALILGCGTIGTLVGGALTADGWQVLGVRRSPVTNHVPNAFPLMIGDISAPECLAALPQQVDAVLLCATPGLRRGRDHGLAAGARLIAERYPAARVIYTGSTAVYGDVDGQGVDEQGTLGTDPAVAGLLAIETEVSRHPDSVTFRIAGLVGPRRIHAQERIRAAALAGLACVVKGNPDRPFSYLHDLDCAELCVLALHGKLGNGVLNAAAPERLTVRGYFQLLAQRLDLSVEIIGDGSTAPSRWIDAGRLWRILPNHIWRQIDARS